ncbi:transmembrane protein 201 isoform X1 [Elephas maximus indicus]|uniref:transmembrane protein 201 isoform X1 n=1 Tax=Elephas maximus indicus TaxID=99487 RepID=UPI00211661E5|nr:transmembrane protein 201 isoform X1 [Elephas maximus indicus]
MEGVSALLAGCPTAGLAGGLGVTACAAAGLLLYRIARRKPTHTIVNCWFCNQDTVVPYGNRNCWDCPHCEQYNGFQENGDYNKPIPAQYLEHLNHVVSSTPSPRDPAQPQQWVSSQVLLCKRCSHHQTTKIKQLAAFAPREESRYDEEIEVYRHHLEQMYKLCRPCQAAVEYYIKHQNRQLRALLLSQQFRRREADQSCVQSFCSSALKAPVQVIVLRTLAFLACAFLLTTALYSTGDPFTPGAALPPALPPGGNGSAAPDNGTAPVGEGWQQLLGLLPEPAVEKLREAWAFGQSHQTGIAVLGLLTCLLAMLLAGHLRLRRIDAFASCLWALLLGLHLADQYLQATSPSWLDTVKFSTTSLCCLVGFTAAVATRKATGPRRVRPRRYFPGDPTGLFPTVPSLTIPCPGVGGASPALLIPTPPGFLPLTSQQLFRSPRRASPSSLPGRLHRALSLGTMPSLTRADSGYLFSGSRPPSQVTRSGEVPVPDYFSLLSGSCLSSSLPSPAPSVAGSLASSSSSLRHRRPLISPARLNLKGQKLLLFPSPPGEALNTPSSSDEPSPHDGSLFTVEPSQATLKPPPRDTKHTVDMGAIPERGRAYSSRSIKKEDDSSQSSTCVVDTTTRAGSEETAAWRGRFNPSLVRGLLAVSLAANALFTSAYLYQSLR